MYENCFLLLYLNMSTYDVRGLLPDEHLRVLV